MWTKSLSNGLRILLLILSYTNKKSAQRADRKNLFIELACIVFLLLSNTRSADNNETGSGVMAASGFAQEIHLPDLTASPINITISVSN